MSPDEWYGWKPRRESLSEPTSMTTLLFECASADWVAEVGRLMAQSIAAPVWFVDAADQVWPAGDVDAHRLALA